MKFTTSSIALVLLACRADAAKHHRTTGSRRVVANGDDVTDPFKYPYFARIDFDGSQACGGSLIHPEFVLSAAHCFLYPDEQVDIYFNTLQFDDVDPTKKAKIVEIVNHPAYDDWYGLNDVALIQIEPINFTEHVLINTDANLTSGGDSVVVMGYGLDETQIHADILQEVELKITDDETCDAENYWTGGINGPSMICALDPEFNQDACTADSGGPLVVLGGREDGASPSQQDVLVGVVSSGTGECGQNEASGVYSEVAFFSSWIEWHVCQNAIDASPLVSNCTGVTEPEYVYAGGTRASTYVTVAVAIAGIVAQAIW
eukprot:CAMPEP_0113466756 /NCGR_PEP_ID=MMETSP0014_2-20120614/14445_1 /TAXON_ID=2857 /ORGANISM="Nitzschia sp." /LENGTH=316 /DNA_ID=CAMNT_0000359007 /DNA_START=337 /DNA_END=1290 /DNA_ORIENTATION=+ /assembly_acc=CAM_ASM_000159